MATVTSTAVPLAALTTQVLSPPIMLVEPAALTLVNEHLVQLTGPP